MTFVLMFFEEDKAFVMYSFSGFCSRIVELIDDQINFTAVVMDNDGEIA